MQKTGAEKEAELCHFIPGEKKGYRMHHLSYFLLRKKAPKELESLLSKHIEGKKKLAKLPSPPRAKRRTTGSRGQSIKMSNADLTNILKKLQEANENELASKIQSQITRSLPQVKRELIDSIRKNEPSTELWDALHQELAKLEKSAV